MRRLIALVLVAAAGMTAEAVEVIAPEDVAPGARGICVTELTGGELVEIPLTVMGSLGATAPEQEAVLIRLDDPRFADTGILAGMSGSPVTIDGKLLGALAFGWSFSKEPIGGVTPFGRMEQLAGDGGPQAAAGAVRPRLAELLAAARGGGLGEMVVEWLVPARRDGLEQLPLALAVGGWQATGSARWIAESWRRLGWVGAPGGAGGPGTAAGTLRPGSMVSAVLLDGDGSVAAGGTVTEIRGDAVWAFGHPFMGAGTVHMPLARASVLGVLPNQAVSFKFFTVGEIVGAIQSDRSHGIWGRLGVEPTMVPLAVTVDGRPYAFRSIDHPVLMPLMVGFVTDASVATRGRTLGDQTVAIDVEVDYGEDLRASIRQVFAGADASARAAAFTTALVGYLENSPFGRPALAGMTISLESEEGLRSATLVDAIPESTVVRPGERLGVRLRLRPFQGEEFTRRVEIEVPREIPEGRLDLVVADGSSWTVYDLQMRPFRPGSFRDELDLLERLVPPDRVVLALERPDVGVALEGGTLSVPPSLVVQLRSALGPELATTAYGVVRRAVAEMPMAIAAAQRIRLTVQSEERWEDR